MDPRKSIAVETKVKAVLAALKCEKTINQIASSDLGVQVEMGTARTCARFVPRPEHAEAEGPEGTHGRPLSPDRATAVRVELAEKKSGWTSAERRARLDPEGKHICLSRQCQLLRFCAISTKPGTSAPAPGHRVFPYLLRGLAITGPNHVWSTDTTYIALSGGFAFLVAVLDWYSRYMLVWRLSVTLDVEFCLEAL